MIYMVSVEVSSVVLGILMSLDGFLRRLRAGAR